MFQNNPEEFIRNVIKLIKEEKATMIVEHISYNLIDGKYDSTIFTQEKQSQSPDKAFIAIMMTEWGRSEKFYGIDFCKSYEIIAATLFKDAIA